MMYLYIYMYINVIHIHTYLGTLLEYFPSMGYETAFETEFSEPCCAETGDNIHFWSNQAGKCLVGNHGQTRLNVMISHHV